MKHIWLFGLAGMLFATSCSNTEVLIRKTNRTDAITEVNATGMVMRPLVADLDVSIERKTHTYSGDVKLPLEDLKQNAIAGFQLEHNCDYIVDAAFQISRRIAKKMDREIIITVSGLPAHYSRVYQVDSLPKSVTQYTHLFKDVQRVDYLNEITIKEDAVGVEFTTGNYSGLQVDFPLDVNGFESRGFVAIDGFTDEQMPFSVEATINSSNNAETFTDVASIDMASSFAFGLMHQMPATKNINLRLVGGLNFSSYAFDEIADGGTFFDSATLLGLRVGGGLDFKLFRSVRAVAKIHKNLNAIRFISKTGSGELDIEDFEINGANAWNIGAGLRFEF